ncbi:MAG: DUF2508 family protein [Firmicutes bacterium]|nr:DUF2508 family protein [Bacillota bacterium]
MRGRASAALRALAAHTAAASASLRVHASRLGAQLAGRVAAQRARAERARLLAPRGGAGTPPDPAAAAVEEVEEARREWQAAQLYFQTVGEPELIDQAIHWMTAAERRYMYLLRKAREERLAAPLAPPRHAAEGAPRRHA